MGTLTLTGARVRRVRQVGLRPFGVLLCAGLLLGVLTDPAHAAAMSIQTSRSTVIGGEAVRVTGSVRQHVVRPVRLQRRAGDAWVTVKTGRTDARGRFAFRLRPTEAMRLRVYAPRTRVGGSTHRARASGSTAVGLAAQTAAVAPPPTAVQGAPFSVASSFSPARPGRATALQRLVGSTWTTVATGTESATGTTVFTARSATTGAASLRAVALASQGAPVAASRTSTVTVQAPPDTTPPPAPTGLYATAHDGSVALVWSTGGRADDLAGYRVHVATGADGPWTTVAPGPGTATAFEVTGLTNGTSYHFSVTSVDTSGNESESPPAVMATPIAGPDLTAPPPPTGLLTVAGDRVVDLSWQASAAGDVAGYTVYTSTISADGPWAKAPGGLVVGTSRTLSGLVNGTTYYLAVTATDTAGNESGSSAAVTGTPVDPPAVVDHCGTVAADQSWSASSVHRLACSVVIAAGTTVRLEAGSVVKGDTGTTLTVNGTLAAAGTTADPVTVTSLRDDSVGGDTNGDGTASAPEANDWGGVVVGRGGYADLEGTTLAYASTALTVNDGGGAGLHGKVRASTTGVSANTYVDATGVDWGDPSGPWPLGSGASVSGATIDALPWAGWTQPPLPEPTPPGTPPDAADGCRPVMFLGVRGSGESPYERSDDAAYASWLDGFGERVGKVYAGFGAAMSGAGRTTGSWKGIGLRYKALHPPALSNLAFANAAFTASIWEGVDRIDQYLSTEYARCGTSQKYVLAGYSQGALAVHLYLTRRAPAYLRDLVAAVGLVADPAKNGNGAEHVYTDGFVPALPGTSMAAASGTYAKAALPGGGPLPADVTDRTATLCHDHDVVCAPGPGASSATHINYDMAGTEMADLGAWLARTALAGGLPTG